MLYRLLSIRSLLTLLVVVLALLVAGPEVSEAAGKSDRSKKAKRSKAKRSKAKRSKRAKRARAKRRRAKRKRRRRRSRYRGQSVKKEQLRAKAWKKPSGEIWMYSPNWREELRLNIYDEDGNIDDAALAKLDNAFRCRRTGETRASDPRLAVVLSMVYDRFGGKRIELVSAFRFQRNEGSRHYHASAMDIRVKGVSSRELREFAHSLDKGNMGIGFYPRSGFVHIDFRAPGDRSYRWTDYSRPGTGSKGSGPSRKWKRRKPGS
ncbi:MAG: DUF882 domain-containing protein [Deltaproteobacteria bacterium]|nr:DUF882 domain-containing protein [Deltaproteobacteria bacterium]